MARSVGTFSESGGMGRGIGASYTFKNTKSGVKAKGSISKSAKKKADIESTSYSGKELTKKQRKDIAAQNKAAKSMKSTNLDRVESGKKAARSRKLADLQKQEYAYGKGKARGRVEGAVGTAAVLVPGAVLYNKAKNKAAKNKKKK